MRQPTPFAPPLERAFAGSAVVAAGGVLATAWFVHGTPDVTPTLFIGSLVVLACALTGIEARTTLNQAQRADVARVYTAALNGRRDPMLDASPGLTRTESLAQCLADIVRTAKLAAFGRENLAVRIGDAWRAIRDSQLRGEILVAGMGQDTEAIAEAAQGSREVERAYGTCLDGTREAAERLVGVTERLAVEADTLTNAIREVTTQIGKSTGAAAHLAETAFATQQSVAAMSQSAGAMHDAADKLQIMLQRAEVTALNAGIEAARAGEAGGGFAIIANDMKDLSRSGGGALNQLLAVVRDLQQQTVAVCDRLSQISDAVQTQHEFGHALSHAAMLQADAVGRLVRQIGAAQGEVKGLGAQVNGLVLPAARLGVNAAAQQAVQRLPGYADAMAQILRGLPDFSAIERATQRT